MTDRQYAHVMLGVPVSVQTQIRDYLADDTKRGDAIREVLKSLHPDKLCSPSLGGTTYGIYLITVDDDTDAGNLRRILDQWPTIYVVGAWRQNGLPLGQSYDENGAIVGTPKYSLTATRYNALKAAWPAGFTDGSGKLVPPNRMQGQTDWSY